MRVSFWAALLGVVLAATGSRVQASGPGADRFWAVPGKAYPAHTTIAAEPATNSMVQKLFGLLHHQSYSSMGRLNGRGWIQYAQLVRATDEKMYWTYAISYFHTAGNVQAAITDLKKPAQLFQTGGYGGKVLTIASNGKYADYRAFGSGPILVERFCSLVAPDTQTDRAFMLHVCASQDHKLAQRLRANLAATTPGTPIAVTAGNPTIAAHSTVTIHGHFGINGSGVAGVPMLVTFSFKNKTATCSGVTDSNGDASCKQDISHAAKGYTVHVSINFTYGGQDYPTATEFTP